MTRANIAEVALVAGVSKSTVSRVLNERTEYMRDETRQRVLDAVATLGYRPSAVARSLVSKRTQAVGLLISDVGNPYYPEVIHGVEDIALAHGYDVFLCNTNYKLERGMAFVQSLADKQVDGVLVMTSRMSDDLLAGLAERGLPVVLIDWELPAAQGVVGTLAIDFETGIREAVDHLVGLGHRRFAHVAGPLNLRTSRTRRDLFLAALAGRGIAPEQVLVLEGDLRIQGGRHAVPALLAGPEPPTAVFAANDLMALGVIWGARELGARLPEDLSVVGLDDIQLAAEVSPPLTTVALPRHEIGSRAMRMLLDLLPLSAKPQAVPIFQEVIGTQLVVRGSTGRPKAHPGEGR
jgi:LacI family transcriptional regulator